MALLSGLENDEETHNLLSNTEHVHREARELKVRPKFTALGLKVLWPIIPTCAIVVVVQQNQKTTHGHTHTS